MRTDEQLRDAALNNAWALLTTEVWAIIGLTVVGVGLGMCAVGVTRLFLPNVDGDGPTQWRKRHDMLKRLGAIVSGVMALWIVFAYLALAVNLTVWLAAPAAVSAGIAAAGLNHPLFKPVKVIWTWVLRRLRSRVESDDGPGAAAALDDTTYRK